MQSTFDALAAFPAQLEIHFAAFPRDYVNWAPSSWQGMPSEPFTAIEQLCHVRDIEIEGYQVRFRRTLDESTPSLASIDSEEVARQRNYGRAAPRVVIAEFREARERTLTLLRGVEAAQFTR